MQMTPGLWFSEKAQKAQHIKASCSLDQHKAKANIPAVVNTHNWHIILANLSYNAVNICNRLDNFKLLHR